MYLVTLVFTLGSVPIYGLVAFGRTAMKVGFVFLVVPLVSWLLLIAAPVFLAVNSRARSRV
jgi:hypothetical protein